MRRILLIVAKDARRRLRSPLSVLCMLAIPIAITLVVGLIFGTGGRMELPRIPVLIVDEDDGFVSNLFKQGLRHGRLAEMLDVLEVERAEGEALMRAGKASALISIPRGFTGEVLDRKPTAISLLKNPSEEFLPLIVEEIAGTMTVALEGAALVFSEPITGIRGMIDAGRWPAGDETEKLLGSARSRISLVRAYLSDSLITIGEETVVDEDAEQRGAGGINIFAFLLPGSIILGLLFISEISMRDILRERDMRTLARMIAGPVEAWEVLAGKVLSAVAITGIACVLLVAIGRFGFRISWGSPAALAASVLGAIVMCTGIIAFLYGIIRAARVADAVLPVIIVVLSLMGGAMLPYESMSAGMRRIAHFSPVFWASDAIKSVAVAGAGFGDIAAHLAFVYGIGAATLVAGAVLLGARFRKGGW